jgi:hypothetical protein
MKHLSRTLTNAAMNYLQTIFRAFHNADIRVLGRWAINYDSSQIKTKVHQANHDHCGVCDVKYMRQAVIKPCIENANIHKSKYMTAVKMKVKERMLA